MAAFGISQTDPRARPGLQLGFILLAEQLKGFLLLKLGDSFISLDSLASLGNFEDGAPFPLRRLSSLDNAPHLPTSIMPFPRTPEPLPLHALILPTWSLWAAELEAPLVTSSNGSQGLHQAHQAPYVLVEKVSGKTTMR